MAFYKYFLVAFIWFQQLEELIQLRKYNDPCSAVGCPSVF
jgi:hypothetical protein